MSVTHIFDQVNKTISLDILSKTAQNQLLDAHAGRNFGATVSSSGLHCSDTLIQDNNSAQTSEIKSTAEFQKNVSASQQSHKVRMKHSSTRNTKKII